MQVFLNKKEIINEFLEIKRLKIKSFDLKRLVDVDIYAARDNGKKDKSFHPTLLLNDGQDAKPLNIIETMTKWFNDKGRPKFATVGIHSNEQRLREYGVIDNPDYLKRGDKAIEYAKFIHKLIDFFRENNGLFQNKKTNAFAGFSMGGLSAFNYCWRYDQNFSRVGVFSGSFWWRSKTFDPLHPDAYRIMHKIVRDTVKPPSLKFWFETGTKDEVCDRNNNGVIDAIDDTLDLIQELKNKGFQDHDLIYEQVLNGEHNFKTWAEVFPKFLSWAFPEKITK